MAPRIPMARPTRAFSFLKTPGAGVTPAEGSAKPTAGFTLNQVIYPSLLALTELDDIALGILTVAHAITLKVPLPLGW